MNKTFTRREAVVSSDITYNLLEEYIGGLANLTRSLELFFTSRQAFSLNILEPVTDVDLAMARGNVHSDLRNKGPKARARHAEMEARFSEIHPELSPEQVKTLMSNIVVLYHAYLNKTGLEHLKYLTRR